MADHCTGRDLNVSIPEEELLLGPMANWSGRQPIILAHRSTKLRPPICRHMSSFEQWHLAPILSVEFTPCPRLVHPTPLLEEERNVLIDAPVAKLENPTGFDGPGAGARLAADNDPMDALQRQPRYRAEKRFEREKSDGGGNRGQEADAMNVVGVLYGRAHPNVVRPRKVSRQFGGSLGTLRQNLKGMLRCALHDCKTLGDELCRNVLMEEVAHRVHKNHPRTLPVKRQFHHVRLQRNLEAVAIAFLSHGAKAFGHSLRVTMGTPRADLRTAGDRVPSRLGPLDGRGLCHSVLLTARQAGKDSDPWPSAQSRHLALCLVALWGYLYASIYALAYGSQLRISEECANLPIPIHPYTHRRPSSAYAWTSPTSASKKWSEGQRM